MDIDERSEKGLLTAFALERFCTFIAHVKITLTTCITNEQKSACTIDNGQLCLVKLVRINELPTKPQLHLLAMHQVSLIETFSSSISKYSAQMNARN